MIKKLQYYSSAGNYTAAELTASRENWICFLETVAERHKFDFESQAAETFRKLSNAEKHFKTPNYRQIKPAHQIIVNRILDENYGLITSEFINLNDGFADRIINIADREALKYYFENKGAIEKNFTSTFRERDVEDEARIKFCNITWISVVYCVFLRCGLDGGEYFNTEYFDGLYNFNTSAGAEIIGKASAKTANKILSCIATAIVEYEYVNYFRNNKQKNREELLYGNY